ncbi:MAG: hypothetical protein OXT65_06845 [Alphaproteobacteria bacterium]|nr:hypothetical protein [Alphaproteobacteria bacterium]
MTAQDDAVGQRAIQGAGDALGFVLAMDDFKTKVKDALGEDSQTYAGLADVAENFPPGVIEALPRIRTAEERRQEELAAQAAARAATATEEEEKKEEPEKKSGWSSFIGKLTGKERKERKEEREEEREEERKKEAAQKEAESLWKSARNDMLALSSDHHYYVDSLMDWALEMGAPLSDREESQTWRMHQYMDPSFVVGQAQKDLKIAIGTNARSMREFALGYTELAEALAVEDIPAFTKLLHKHIFSQQENAPETANMIRATLLDDYDATSLLDLALQQVSDRTEQANLIQSLADAETRSGFFGAPGFESIFPRLMDEALAEEFPLPPSVLKTVMTKAGPEAGLQEALDATDYGTRAAKRFAHDSASHAALLNNILGVLTGETSENIQSVVKNYARLNAATAPTQDILQDTAQKDGVPLLRALWNQAQDAPIKGTLGEEILRQAQDPAATSAAMPLVLGTGLAQDWEDSSAFLRLRTTIEEDVLPNLNTWSAQSAAQTISWFFERADADASSTQSYKKALTKTNGWLHRVMGSPDISEAARQEWLTVFLAPFAHEAVKANILLEAASNSHGNKVPLETLGTNLVSARPRIMPDTVIDTPHDFSNIWYNPEEQSIYGVTSTGCHKLAGDMSIEDATAVIDAIDRAGSFQHESGALFRADGIDRINMHKDEDGELQCTFVWRQQTAPAHIDDATRRDILTRKDFLHLSDSDADSTVSINMKNIALITTYEDSMLIMDKYGNDEIVDTLDMSLLPSHFTPIGSATLINPENLRMIVIDDKRGDVMLKIESDTFGKFLPSIARAEDEEDGYIHIKASPQERAALSRALSRTPGYFDIFDNDQWFNIAQAGYVIFDNDPNATTFYCRTEDAGARNRISLELGASPQHVQEFKNSLASMPQIISAGNNAFFYGPAMQSMTMDAQKKELKVVCQDDTLPPLPISGRDGMRALAAFAQQPGTLQCTANTVLNLEKTNTLQSFDGGRKMRALHSGSMTDISLPPSRPWPVQQGDILQQALEQLEQYLSGIFNDASATPGTPGVQADRILDALENTGRQRNTAGEYTAKLVSSMRGYRPPPAPVTPEGFNDNLKDATRRIASDRPQPQKKNTPSTQQGPY